MSEQKKLSMGPSRLEVIERDEAGNVKATYIETETTAGNCSRRIDCVVPKNPYDRWTSLINVFLPAGYPNSVTKDYLEYQTYDSMQAFSSSIAGLLSSRAVLEGVGVGDSTASPTAALLLSIIQESMGRLATILFAHKLGNSLVAECKRYRLLADIFNDAAMILDCLSPAFPKPIRVILLSLSSVLRALCGVAAGSAKASLSAHFAKWGNLGELNAKDSSQETIISLMGMLAGGVVVSRVSSALATWSSLLFLLTIHLYTNYKAVRAVSMLTLSRQRANIVLSTFLEQDKILTPEEASAEERVFEWDGVLRWRSSEILGHARIGVKLQVLLASLAGSISAATGSIQDPVIGLAQLSDIFRNEQYLLWIDVEQRRALIVLKGNSTATSQLKAWTQALIATRKLGRGKSPLGDPQGALSLVRETLDEVSNKFDDFIQRVESAGWDIHSPALETRSGFRIEISR